MQRTGTIYRSIENNYRAAAWRAINFRFRLSAGILLPGTSFEENSCFHTTTFEQEANKLMSASYNHGYTLVSSDTDQK
ncbi:hypothetical protein A8C56_23010 [Niabella ginsenosidivorans]|uniref:Uncharacterized protein n=1 Tax=Niabella ginsenosidivorans TaxID=1176587 RepID=A0A1A9IA82_9BACT|nr:hypothetical protein A8C56_23010 [Niabella ginsenosidivorans]